MLSVTGLTTGQPVRSTADVREGLQQHGQGMFTHKRGPMTTSGLLSYVPVILLNLHDSGFGSPLRRILDA